MFPIRVTAILHSALRQFYCLFVRFKSMWRILAEFRIQNLTKPTVIIGGIASAFNGSLVDSFLAGWLS